MKNDFVPYRAKYAKLLSVSGVVFLSQAIAWFEKEGEFTRSLQEWQEATGLTYWQQKKAREKLMEQGILLESHTDMPRKIYFSINKQALNQALGEPLA